MSPMVGIKSAMFLIFYNMFWFYIDPTEMVSEKDLQDASERLLEAKARYALRNTIVESVMMANPVLKAVHAGLNATPIER